MKLLLRRLSSRISTKITLPYLILAVVLATLISVLATNLTVRTLQDRLTNRLVQVGQVTSDALVATEERQLTQLRAIIFTEGVAEALQVSDTSALSALLRPYWANNNLHALVVFDANARTLLHWQRAPGTRQSDPPLVVPAAPVGDWWVVQQIVQGSEDAFGDKFSAFQGQTLYTAAPIRQRGQLIGGVLIGIPLDVLLAQLQSVSQAGVTTLYNVEGRAVATTQVLIANSRVPAVPIESLLQLHDTTLPQPFHTQSVVMISGREFQVAYSELAIRRVMSGYFSVALPRSFIVTAWEQQRVILSLAGSLMVLAVILVGMLVAQAITRPIEALARTAQAITAGALEARSSITSRDEIGALARSFNHMTERLQHLYETSRQLSVYGSRDAIVATVLAAARGLSPGATPALLLKTAGRWTLLVGDTTTPGFTAHGTALTDDLIVRALARRSAFPVVASAEARRLRRLQLPADVAEVCYAALPAQDETLGLLLMLSPARSSISTSALEPLAALARMSASALYNAQLYRTVQEEAAHRQAILERIADAVIVCDEQRNVVLMNPAAEALLRISDWHQRRHRFDSLPLQPLPEQILLHQQNTSLRYDVHGTVVSASRALLHIAGQTAAGEVVVLRNISAEAALEQTKTDLLALISHELRTPMTAIKGAVEMMSRGVGGSLSPLQREMADIALRQTQALGDVIEKAVVFTRVETGQITCTLRPVQIDGVMRQAVNALADLFARSNISARIVINDERILALADEYLLTFVLRQLLENALRYGGGAAIELAARRCEAEVIVEVRDFGPGIDEALLPSLLSGLHRGAQSLGSEHRGLGIGLLLAREFMLRQEGKIELRSRRGEGTTVVITLRAEDERPSRAAVRVQNHNNTEEGEQA